MTMSVVSRFDYIEGRIDLLDDNLQVFKTPAAINGISCMILVTQNMCDINTRLSSLMMTQGAQTICMHPIPGSQGSNCCFGGPESDLS